MNAGQYYPIYELQRHLALVWQKRSLLPATTYRAARRQILESLLDQRRFLKHQGPF